MQRRPAADTKFRKKGGNSALNTDSTPGVTNGPGGGLGANTLGPYGGRQVQLGARIDF